MPLHDSEDTLALLDVVTVEEAELVATWLRSHPGGAVDLGACTHLHTAALQALLAARPQIAAAPSAAPFLQRWVLPWLTTSTQNTPNIQTSPHDTNDTNEGTT